MRRPFKALLAPLALLLAAPACAGQATQDADPALWVVKDRDTTVYLFGTIHVLKPGLSWFDEAVKAAFDKADQVMLELVMPDPAAMQAIVTKYAIAPAGTPPLSRRLPAREQAAYLAEMKSLGLDPASFDRMQPWFAATNLSLLPLMKLGYDPSNGPEAVITKAAGAAGKPVAGLETAEQQIGFFASLPQPAQLKFLEATIDEAPKANAEFEAMVDRWSHGDSAALAKLLNDDLSVSPQVKQVLLVNRNRTWARWIKARMARPGTVFVAVGAGHLAGSDSVQAQLAKLGVKAVRVKY